MSVSVESKRIIRCRHSGYSSEGLPVVREMPTYFCADDIGTFVGGRHFRYTNAGIPVTGFSLECCDTIRPDDEEKVEMACFPGGIPRKIRFGVGNVDTCIPTSSTTGELNYTGPSSDGTGCTCDSSTAGKWTGGFDLPGGTVALDLCCIPAVSELDVPTFRLVYSCLGEGTCQEFQAACTAPLFFDYSNLDFPLCCRCNQDFTTHTGSVFITLFTDCLHTVWARHVGYTSGGIPLVARERRCQYDSAYSCGCGTMTCGVLAQITAIDSDCDCLNSGVFELHQDSDFNWTKTLTSGCDHPVVDVSMACTAGESEGTVRLDLSINCGADNGGSGFVTIPACDLDSLDVTFTVGLSSSAPTDCGGCLYLFDEMANTWLLQENNCTCGNCVDPVIPGTPGQFTTTPCDGEVPAICCVGSVSVRVTREGGGLSMAMAALAVDPAPVAPAVAPAQRVRRITPENRAEFERVIAEQRAKQRYKGCGCGNKRKPT